ncbi:MAG: triose-phosphate isomerase [Zoogloeaceae bacterium]|jgi:triosephosphate isomerase|nr:triose-phosphate isomerase [Zoogloeaceae bacterium]
MSRQKLVMANWKMHGSQAENAALADAFLAGWPKEAADRVQTAICPPFVYLPQIAARLSGSPVAWGAQDVSVHAQGAFTGEVAASMLADLGCRYVLVGHSERRALHGETDDLVAQKFVAAQGAGLVPVLCLGENLAEREAGQTLDVVFRQLDAVLQAAGAQAFAQAVIAYEPVWAIGTGKTATAEEAQAVHAALRERLQAAGAAASAIQILYGGSVKPGNAAELFGQPDIDGGLIGGAALVASDFLAVCTAALQG